MCVWPAKDSAPEHHTNSRPVSLEPVWLEAVQSQIFFRKVTGGRVSEKKGYATYVLFSKCYIGRSLIFVINLIV
jgi:hypothetical protein